MTRRGAERARAPGVSGEPGNETGTASRREVTRFPHDVMGEERHDENLGGGRGCVPWGRSLGGASVQRRREGGSSEIHAVQIVPAGQKQVGNPGEKGATYYALEAQTTRLTTRFHDGHVAVTERGLVGDVRTTLRDPPGTSERDCA